MHRGDGRHDVGSGHDPGVEVDLGVFADFANDLGQQVEGNGRTIELAPAVVGEQDAVDSHIGESLRIVDVLHSFDDKFARPLFFDPREIFEGDRWIEHRVQ